MGGGPRILIVGGGYGGMHTALCLERLLRPGEATVMVAGPQQNRPQSHGTDLL